MKSGFAALAVVIGWAGLASADEAPVFHGAKPVWAAGRETEMNLTIGFRAVVPRPDGPVVLRVAASTIYRASVNGAFLGHGPARGPHGFYRIDEWDVTSRLTAGQNVIALEVAGYNANSYYLLDQPAFLQAEVMAGGEVLASTAGPGKPFEAGVFAGRVQRVQRYSFQRPFVEVYRLGPDAALWMSDPATPLPPVELAVQPEKRLLARGVLAPDFAVRVPTAHVAHGRIEPRDPGSLWKDRSLTAIGPQLKGYPENALEVVLTSEAQGWAMAGREPLDRPWFASDTISLDAHTQHILDLGQNLTGFLRVRAQCAEPTRLWLVFDEVLRDGDVDFKRLGCCNIVELRLEPGTCAVETIEPYTLRYLKLVALEGRCTLSEVGLREYGHPPVEATFRASDKRLNRLFAAGVSTFRQNALDVFMDCPSRERAGWLCDSFFTSRVEKDLAGQSRIEKNFFENFLLPERFEYLPQGMLPMCYPSDHNDGVFIPNWALWFVVELEEYAARSGDRATVEALRPKVLALFDYFKPFENSDGLLEKLPGWVFVEWSKANEFVQDVNYPSNMLFAGALASAGRMYGLPDLEARSARIAETIRRQSFDGEFFVDNALRREGRLEVTRNRSEVCQYFAFFFNVATPATHAELWRRLRDEFGPDRKERKLHQEVHAANSFIGNMLRMELLSRAGRSQQILDESIAYLLYMADRTGTLWENVGDYASCNHGFASHACHTLYRDVLGVYRVDSVRRQVVLRWGDAQLDWCEGSLPTPDGPMSLHWEKREGTIHYRLNLPAGYTVTMENPAGLKLVEDK